MVYDIEMCKLMFKHGCAFAECGKHCEIEPISNEQKVGSFAIAGIVNSAFACEIFLKTLLVISGYTEKLHGQKLFDLWNELGHQNSSLSDRIRLGIQDSFFSEDNLLLDKLLSVETISDAFCHWRYIFEEDKSTKLCINWAFIRNFRTILQEICCEAVWGCSWSEYCTQE